MTKSYYIFLFFFSAGVFSVESYSPNASQDDPINLFWGDTHLHTNLSVDANGLGNKNLGPDVAYEFAKGSKVTAHNGMEVRLRRPLDFLVVADHAVNMGVIPAIIEGDATVLSTKVGKLWQPKLDSNPDTTKEKFFWKSWAFKGEKAEVVTNSDFRLSVWEKTAKAADKHNDPGTFTAFTGYEWTPFAEGAFNLHRVMIFKDAIDKTLRTVPFSNYDSPDVEDLWAVLSDYEETTGGEVLAIPHNGNLTKGLMFALETYNKQPFTKAYAQTRARWEPLYEVTQIKGDSETHPVLSPTDEFADYETWNGIARDSTNNEERPYEYARSALKLGLGLQSELGVNPFKFGMIGSTDSHTSLVTADEDNFWGKTTTVEPSPTRAEEYARYSAAGYAGVWAHENTRESLFAAMKRKEVYASTGPRITVRFFGGWDYEASDASKPDLASVGYANGVPMGGDLTHGPKGKSPNFLIRAVRDPDGANLDRVQLIKGWRTESGELEEKVYDVALSDGRKVGRNGKVKPVGSTVDANDASYSNSIGDPELAVVWTDPDFNPDELAFYYVRILEIPTPRWTAYDAKFFGLEDLPKEIPMVTQERAYTSPIWYTPAD